MGKATDFLNPWKIMYVRKSFFLDGLFFKKVNHIRNGRLSYSRETGKSLLWDWLLHVKPVLCLIIKQAVVLILKSSYIYSRWEVKKSNISSCLFTCWRMAFGRRTQARLRQIIMYLWLPAHSCKEYLKSRQNFFFILSFVPETIFSHFDQLIILKISKCAYLSPQTAEDIF